MDTRRRRPDAAPPQVSRATLRRGMADGARWAGSQSVLTSTSFRRGVDKTKSDSARGRRGMGRCVTGGDMVAARGRFTAVPWGPVSMGRLRLRNRAVSAKLLRIRFSSAMSAASRAASARSGSERSSAWGAGLI